jgi:hypothetical protein
MWERMAGWENAPTCICGSIMSGHLRAFETMMPFSTETESVGSPEMVHWRILTGSCSVLIRLVPVQGTKAERRRMRQRQRGWGVAVIWPAGGWICGFKVEGFAATPDSCLISSAQAGQSWISHLSSSFLHPPLRTFGRGHVCLPELLDPLVVELLAVERREGPGVGDAAGRDHHVSHHVDLQYTDIGRGGGRYQRRWGETRGGGRPPQSQQRQNRIDIGQFFSPCPSLLPPPFTLKLCSSHHVPAHLVDGGLPADLLAAQAADQLVGALQLDSAVGDLRKRRSVSKKEENGNEGRNEEDRG